MECRQPVRFGGLPHKAHAGIVRRAAAFLVVAAEAGCDDIVPALLAAPGDGHDVVERQIL